MRVRDDGSFRSANQGGLVAFTMGQWRRYDHQAADQFRASSTVDRAEALQLEFIAATGLGLRDRLSASLADAHHRYGGPYVTSTRSSRT